MICMSASSGPDDYHYQSTVDGEGTVKMVEWRYTAEGMCLWVLWVVMRWDFWSISDHFMRTV